MPELPAQKRARFVEVYGLREYDAQALTQTRPLAEYYERVATVSGDPRAAANWVMGDLSGALNAAGRDITESPVPAAHLGELVGLIRKNEISGKLAKEIFPKMFAGGEAPRTIMEREGLTQISDTGALEKIVDEVIAGNAKQAEQFKSGKTAVTGFLEGQVMKASRVRSDRAAGDGLGGQ